MTLLLLLIDGLVLFWMVLIDLADHRQRQQAQVILTLAGILLEAAGQHEARINAIALELNHPEWVIEPIVQESAAQEPAAHG